MDIIVIFISLLGVSSALTLKENVAAMPDSDRLARVEDILETVVVKNQALEERIEFLENELQKQRIENDELKKTVNMQNSDELTEIEENGKMTKENQKESGKWVERQPTQSFDNKSVQGPTEPKHLGARNQNGGIKRQAQVSRVTTVAFTVSLSRDFTGLGAGHTIRFDRALTNVGGGYNIAHANFVAPVSGVYVFSLTAMSLIGTAEHLEVVKDGASVGVVFVNSSPNFASTSAIITLQLTKGNEVWVKTAQGSWHGSGSLHGGYTSFSGWLLPETE